MKNNSFIAQLIFLCLFFSQNTLAMIGKVGQGVRGLGREIPKTLPKTSPVVLQPQRPQQPSGGFGTNQGMGGGQRGLQVPTGKATESLLKPGRTFTLPLTGPTFAEVNVARQNIPAQTQLQQNKDANFFNTIKRGITLGPISNKAVQELIKNLPEAEELFKEDSIIIRDSKDGSLLFSSDKSDSGLGWNIQIKSSDAIPTLRAIYGTGEKTDIYERLGDNFPSEVTVTTLKTSNDFIQDVINLFKPILEHTPAAKAKRMLAKKAALELQQAKLLEEQAQAQLKAEQEAKELAKIDELVKKTMEDVEQEVYQTIEKQETEKSQDEQKALQEYYEKEIAQLKEARVREAQEQDLIDIAQLKAQAEQFEQRLAEFKEQQIKDLAKTQEERKAELTEFIEKEEQQLNTEKQELAQARKLAEQQRAVELEQENKIIQQQEQKLLESKQKQEELKNERRQQLKDQKIIEFQQAQQQRALDLTELKAQAKQSKRSLAELKELQTKELAKIDTENEAELAEFIKNEKLAFEIKQQEEIARQKAEQATFLGSITKGPQAQLADIPEKQIIDTQLQRQVAEELPLDQPRKQIISSKDPQTQLADVPEKQIIDTQLQRQVAEELPLDQPRKQIISSKDSQAQLADVPEKQIIDTQLQRQVAEELPLDQPKPTVKPNISTGHIKEKQPELLAPLEQKQPQDLALSKTISTEQPEPSAIVTRGQIEEELGSGDANDNEEEKVKKENFKQDELLTDAEKEKITIPSIDLPSIEKIVTPEIISSDVASKQKISTEQENMYQPHVTTPTSRVLSPVIQPNTLVYVSPIQQKQLSEKRNIHVDSTPKSFGRTNYYPTINVGNYKNQFNEREQKPAQENKNSEVNNKDRSYSSYQPQTYTSAPKQIVSRESSSPSTESPAAVIPLVKSTNTVIKQPIKSMQNTIPYQDFIVSNEPEDELEGVMSYTETPMQKKPSIEKPNTKPIEQSLNWFVRLLAWIKSLFLKITSPIRALFGA